MKKIAQLCTFYEMLCIKIIYCFLQTIILLEPIAADKQSQPTRTSTITSKRALSLLACCLILTCLMWAQPRKAQKAQKAHTQLLAIWSNPIHHKPVTIHNHTPQHKCFVCIKKFIKLLCCHNCIYFNERRQLGKINQHNIYPLDSSHKSLTTY